MSDVDGADDRDRDRDGAPVGERAERDERGQRGDNDRDGDEIVFDLADWDAGGRLLLRGALTEAGIAHVWEGSDLVVAAADEEAVEAMVDEFEQAEPLGDDDDDEEEDDGEIGAVSEADEAAAQQAMGDLFVAADRLAGSPLDDGVADDFAAIADDVADLPPPYGLDPSLWAQIGELAGSLTEQLDDAADADVITSDARMLRELLRKYV